MTDFFNWEVLNESSDLVFSYKELKQKNNIFETPCYLCSKLLNFLKDFNIILKQCNKGAITLWNNLELRKILWQRVVATEGDS